MDWLLTYLIGLVVINGMVIGTVAIDHESLCTCHKNENDDSTHQTLEIKAGNRWFRHCNATIPQKLLLQKPIVKYPGKSLLYHDMLTLVVFTMKNISHPKGIQHFCTNYKFYSNCINSLTRKINYGHGANWSKKHKTFSFRVLNSLERTLSGLGIQCTTK